MSITSLTSDVEDQDWCGMLSDIEGMNSPSENKETEKQQKESAPETGKAT
jgi:hypothetical protein